MRIVHLNPFYFPYAGGIERRIRSLARRMARRHEVHIVTAQQPGSPAGTEVEEGGATVHRLPSRFPLRGIYNPPPVLTRGLQDYLRRLAPDVVDYHFRWSPGYNRAFRNLACPGVATYHNTFGEGQGALGWASQVNDRLFMRTLRRARRVACVSDFIRRDLADHGADADRLVVSHNAIEPADFAGKPQPPSWVPDRPFVVAVGRVVALKGLDVLVDAWPQVAPGLDLVVAGQGPERRRLEARARRLGVADRIHFPGWVSEPEKVALLQSALAYAHPARFEAFGISILEAMACGAPVVAARVGGIPEVVGDAGTLLGHDAADWARELSALHADPQARKRSAAASRRQAATFDWDRITSELLATYEVAVRA